MELNQYILSCISEANTRYSLNLRDSEISSIADETTRKLQSRASGKEPPQDAAPLEISVPPSLPEKAPALWKDAKEPGDTPPDFIKRWYKPWLAKDNTPSELSKCITRADLRRLDPSLDMALQNWLRKNTLPPDCPLPTVKDRNDALVALAFSGEKIETTLLRSDPENVLRRLAHTLDRREQRSRKRGE